MSVFLALLVGCQTDGGSETKSSRAAASKIWKEKNPVWRGVHFIVGSDAQAAALKEQLPRLAAVDVNTVIVETNYNFEFKSHPELSSTG